jgi:hypothetical protein
MLLRGLTPYIAPTPQPLEPPMKLLPTDRREQALIAGFAALALVAVFGPDLPPRETASGLFADARALSTLPNAMDVLSNLAFVAFGVWGLWWLRALDQVADHLAGAPDSSLPMPLHPTTPAEPPANMLDCAWLFFAGLLLTATGSVFYHLQPDAFRLAADRAGMAVAFAGLVGLAVGERVSLRASWPAAWFTLAAGLLAVAVFHETGNELPWAVVQFGGVCVVMALALTRPVASAIGLKLWWVLFFYALAKLFELGDQTLYAATHQLISGHTLKHLTAALAALPVLQALQAVGRETLRHNQEGSAAIA